MKSIFKNSGIITVQIQISAEWDNEKSLEALKKNIEQRFNREDNQMANSSFGSENYSWELTRRNGRIFDIRQVKTFKEEGV